ncbi:MAG: hypothetical protein Kow0042_26250 [Calditrichia bacterium]
MMRIFLNDSWAMMRQNVLAIIMFGVFFLLIGMLILFVPEIIIAFIASIFFFIGGMLIYWGWRARKYLKETQRIKINWF